MVNTTVFEADIISSTLVLGTNFKLKIMKKLLLTILISSLFIACTYKKGEILESPKDFIIIHGKTYKLMRVVPEDNARPIWIMYPKDSLDKQPELINWTYTTGGKNITTHSETLIKVD